MSAAKRLLFEQMAETCSECGAGPGEPHTNPPWCGLDDDEPDEPPDEDDEPDETPPDCSECGAPEGDHVGECSQAFGDCQACGAPGTCHVHPCPEAWMDTPCAGCGHWFGKHTRECPV